MEKQKTSAITLPGAIIIAGAIIAVAIIWVKQPVSSNGPSSAAALENAKRGEMNMREITTKDHIYGNPNAPIKIVEYSDASCPYCKTFNPTMVKLIEEYGPSGKVAWIYRHFPLDKPDETGFILHKNAGREAEAMECAAALGGNEKFWDYEEKLYEVTPSVTQATPNGLDPKQLPIIAKDVGLDPVAFNECLASGQFKEKIEADYLDGINAGITGTPFSVIITPSGTKIPLPGAQSYTNIKTAIDALLAEGSK
ncbi:MAG: thioredoxin domain-containing protein [Candidatus Paceibacterota bacterium]|jgi:protein-disulfide isomerase